MRCPARRRSSRGEGSRCRLRPPWRPRSRCRASSPRQLFRVLVQLPVEGRVLGDPAPQGAGGLHRRCGLIMSRATQPPAPSLLEALGDALEILLEPELFHFGERLLCPPEAATVKLDE